MPKLRSYLGYCLVVVAILWTGSARSDDIVVGSVIGVRGDVALETAGERHALALRDPVHVADTIVSGAGKAKIALNDGSIVSVGENSRVVFRDYQSTANGLKTRLGLLQGVLHFFVKRSVAGAQFEVDTETAVAAVRGTDWLMEATPDRTSVAVLQGAVAVSGRGESAGPPALLDQPGQGVDVARGEARMPVRLWSAERLATTLARASFD